MNSLSLPTSGPFPLADGPVLQQDSLVEILWRRRNILLATTAAALALGLLYILFVKPTYTASSRVYVRAGGQGLLTPKVDHAVSDNTPFLFTQREMIGSTPVLAEALGRPGILELKSFAGQTNTLDYLKTKLDVDVGKKDELITVSYETPYKDEAAPIVAAVVAAYCDFQASQQVVSTSAVASTLQAQKSKSETELAAKLDALHAFAREHDIVGASGERTTQSSQTLSSIAASITAAHLETMNTKALLEQYPAPKSPASQPAMTNEAYQGMVGIGDDQISLRDQLMRAKATLDIVSRQLMPEHPIVVAARNRVDQLATANYYAVSKAYDAACKREQDMREYYAQEQRRMVEQDAYAAEYTRMESEVGRIEKLCDSLDTRIRELGVTDDGAIATVNVIEPARVDDHPASPKKARTLGLALLAGLLVGGLAACVSDRLDTRLRSEAEIKQHLGLSPLALMPELSAQASPVSRALNVFHEPQSRWADACRALRSAILFGPANRRKKTILIASPTRGDGRSIVASSLAISLAEAGRRVLLIDADLRLPMQDWIFGVKGEGGLASLLAARSFDPTAFARTIQPTVVPSLDVLPGYGTTANSSDLFNSKTFIDLLAFASEAYDHVVFDSPPSAAQNDARIIGASCDVTLLVACLGKHNRNTVAQTRDDLMNIGANVIGIVLNPAPDCDTLPLRDVGKRLSSDTRSGSHQLAEPALTESKALGQADLSEARPMA